MENSKLVNPKEEYKTMAVLAASTGVVGFILALALSGFIYTKFLKTEPVKASAMAVWCDANPRQAKQAKDDWENLQEQISQQASAASETYFIPRFVKK